MPDKSIDVSVIVPMYNVENLISETIESLKLNSKYNIEFLIIDDGSTDSSYIAVKQAISNDERFIIIRQSNQGVSAARNKALDLARGEYICFVDSDDIVPNGAIDRMYSTAKEQKADLVYGSVKKFNSEKEWFNTSYLKNNIFNIGQKSLINNPELVYFLGIAGKLLSRMLLVNLRFPVDIHYTEDQVVMYQAFLNAEKIYTIGDLVYLYRERDTDGNEASATQSQDKNAYKYFMNSLSTLLMCRKVVYSINQYDENQKIELLRAYYSRMFTHDSWPLLVRVLKGGGNVKEALKGMLEFCEKHDRSEINKIATFRYFIINALIDKVFYMPTLCFNSYRQLLFFIFEKLDSDVKKLCSKQNVYGQKWQDSYNICYYRYEKAFLYFNFVKSQKLIFNKIKNEPEFIREKLFPNLIKLPINKNKVVFATTRQKPMSSNFDEVYRALKSRDDLIVYKFLGHSSKAKTIFSRYYHLATANVVFLEDYYKPIYGLSFKGNTKVIQLWHACGAFKKFSFSALGANDSNTPKFESEAHSSYTHVVTSSKYINSIYSEAFNSDVSKVKSYGVPRTDIYFDKHRLSVVENKINKKYPDLKNTINILYAPTFRGGAGVRSTFNLNIDWSLISENLPDNFRIIIKLHPAVKNVYPPIPSYVKDKVTLLPSSTNVDEMMIYSDVLITDYSSLIFEYSLLNKPIIYYPYDIDEYFDERGFYFDYSKYVYGDVVYNTESLILSIKDAFIKQSLYVESREQFKDLFMSNCDGKSTQRLIELVL